MTLKLTITSCDVTALKDAFYYVAGHLNRHGFNERASFGGGGALGPMGSSSYDLRIIDDSPAPPLTPQEIRDLRHLLRERTL